jgi:hypothetical protein
MPADADGDVVLQAIEAQHGLLIERAQSIYSFSHLTFQEFFAARHIVSNPHNLQFEALASHAHDERWRELLLLTASMLTTESAMFLFQIWTAYLKQATNGSLIRSMLTTVVQWNELHHSVQVYPDRVTMLVLVLGVFRARARTSASERANALVRANERASDLDRASERANARANSRNLVLNLARDFDLASDLASARANSRDLAHNPAHAHNLARDLASARARARDRANARALASARDLDLTSDLDQALDRDLERARTLARDLTSARDLDLISNLTNTITKALVLFVLVMLKQKLSDYQTEPSSLIKQYLWWYTMRWSVETTATIDDADSFHTLRVHIEDSLHQLASSNLDQSLTWELLTDLPPQLTANIETWQEFVNHTHEYLRIHKNIQNVQQATAQDAQLLEEYLTSTLRLVECLKLAAIEDRNAILNELLVLPDGTV